jgi:hypothetical protein
MYQGNLLSVLGLLLALGARGAWLTLSVFVAAQAWRIRREEAFLAAAYGPDWSRRRALGLQPEPSLESTRDNSTSTTPNAPEIPCAP